MRDDNRTKKQLVIELAELRSQNNALKKSMTGSISAELTAEEARRFAESIVETVREPLLVLDADLKIISANRYFYSTFKVIPGETLGCFIYDLGNKQWDIPELRELLEEVLPEKQAFDDFEVDHNFQDIGQKIMLLNACRIYRKDIGARMILLAIEDITERKRLENLLEDSEERYRRLFETASDGIVLLEKSEGKITHANPATEKMLGYTKTESIGNKLQDIGVLLDRGDFQTTIKNLNQSGIINYRNVKVETKSGQHIDTEIYLVDRAKLVQCNIRDITERKQAMEALRESEEKYHDLFDFLPIPVYEMDFESNIISANRAVYETFRGTEEDFKKGFKAWQHLSPEDIDKSRKNIQRLLKGEQIGGTEYTLMRLDGSVFPAIVISSVIYTDDKPVGLRGAIIDITQRKQAEEALHDAEMRYRLLFEHAPDGIVIIDPATTRFLEFNDCACQQLGYSREEFANLTILDIDAHETSEVTRSRIATVMSTGRNDFDTRHRTKQGEIRDIHVTAQITETSGHPVYHCVWRDITDRKKSEAELRRTLDSLKRAVETTVQVMVSAVEIRDPYTSGHQIRSADLASAIATEMGLPSEKIEGIRMAGSIHDIGKLSIPAEILSKPTKLSEIEFLIIKEHARRGFEMLRDVESPWPLAEIVYQHHERMDGSGYPKNLKGEEICMEARILAVADVVEAMASHRPYRPGLGIDAALHEIENNKGIFYDNTVADTCLRLFREKGFKLEGTCL